jgi:hypothetical protein
LDTVVAQFTTTPIGGIFIKPKAKRRVYWTNVSANTKVWIGHTGVGRSVSHAARQYIRVAVGWFNNKN